MNNEMVALMLGVSLLLGVFGLLAFLWGLKGGQFDDGDRMMKGVLFDGADDLNAMAQREKGKNKEKENVK